MRESMEHTVIFRHTTNQGSVAPNKKGSTSLIRKNRSPDLLRSRDTVIVIGRLAHMPFEVPKK